MSPSAPCYPHIQWGQLSGLNCLPLGFTAWPFQQVVPATDQRTGGCFTNVSRALQNNLAKIYNASNHICGENFKLKLCTCAQSMALGTQTKFQLEMLIGSAISATHKFRENILKSLRNVSETTPRWRQIMSTCIHTKLSELTLTID